MQQGQDQAEHRGARGIPADATLCNLSGQEFTSFHQTGGLQGAGGGVSQTLRIIVPNLCFPLHANGLCQSFFFCLVLPKIHLTSESLSPICQRAFKKVITCEPKTALKDSLLKK